MNHNHSQANHNVHLWLMLACCLIPIGLILAVAVFGISLGALTPFLPFALVLLCPLMMFFMMRGMRDDATEQKQTGVSPNATTPSVPSVSEVTMASEHQQVQ